CKAVGDALDLDALALVLAVGESRHQAQCQDRFLLGIAHDRLRNVTPEPEDRCQPQRFIAPWPETVPDGLPASDRGSAVPVRHQAGPPALLQPVARRSVRASRAPSTRTGPR